MDSNDARGGNILENDNGTAGPVDTSTPALDVEDAVRQRYSDGAQERQEALCCPTSYDPKLLEAIPEEVIERDYGCGDPTQYLEAGETVLDLGSGTGKACFMAAQVVGETGRVIGVDMNDDMLALARKSVSVVAERIGYENVVFKKGKIQDLSIDRDLVDGWLRDNPVTNEADLVRCEAFITELKSEKPLVSEASVDVVVSNCVLNLVKSDDKLQLFSEIFRVLRPGGRAVISDIVSDETVPAELMADPELWSGCISGALREDSFLGAFEEAGLHGIEILERGSEPWRTVEGIEFRSLTVAAYKPEAPSHALDLNHAVVYRGPFKQVVDDHGRVFVRGERTAVSDRAFRQYSETPFSAHVESIEPRESVSPEGAPAFEESSRAIPGAAASTSNGRVRSPRETKGADYKLTTEEPGSVCEPTTSASSGKKCC